MRYFKILAILAVSLAAAGCVAEKPRLDLSQQQTLLTQNPLDGTYEGEYDVSGAMMSYTSPSRLIIKTQSDGKLGGTFYSGYHKRYFRIQDLYLSGDGKTVHFVVGRGQRFERRFALRREGNVLRGNLEVEMAGAGVPATGSASFVKVEGVSKNF